jgi:hypothetical protein
VRKRRTRITSRVTLPIQIAKRTILELAASSCLTRGIGNCSQAVTRSTSRVDESLRRVGINFSAQVADDDAEYDDRVKLL